MSAAAASPSLAAPAPRSLTALGRSMTPVPSWGTWRFTPTTFMKYMASLPLGSRLAPRIGGWRTCLRADVRLSLGARADQHRSLGGSKDLGGDAAESCPSDHAETAATHGHEGPSLIPLPSDKEYDAGSISLDHLDLRVATQHLLEFLRPLVDGLLLPEQHLVEPAAVLGAPAPDRLGWVLVGPHQHASGPEELAYTGRQV